MDACGENDSSRSAEAQARRLVLREQVAASSDYCIGDNRSLAAAS